MPTYDFRNKETDEVFVKIMRIAEKEQYLIENPHIEQLILTAPAFTGDHIVIKKDSGFKEVLQKIKSETSYADFDKTSSQI
jgi:hypothetical protein